ncbi:MAG TPA: CvpA family protein [Dehalococcoidales bacterium]
MNWLDAILIIFGIIALLSGLRTGLIKSIIPLAGLIIGLFLALRYYEPFGELMSFLPQPTVAKWVAFAIILITVLLISGGLAKLVSWAFSSLMLGWLDHLLGAIWGLLFGTVVYAALLAIWVELFGETAIITGSPIATFLLDHFPTVLGLLPDEFEAVHDFFR